jgi:muramoyltetrapeptide carboxypeptidase
MSTIIPPYLKKGSTIGITCPAGYMAVEKVQACIQTLQQWGYRVMLGKTVGSASINYFSGADEERADELQAMLDNNAIDAILFGRGGYGVSRIIDTLDFNVFRKKPKWLIGYSDITILHTHIHNRYKIATLHAPMAGAFNDDPGNNIYIQSVKNALKGKKTKYQCAVTAYNKTGKASGMLVGGNLTLLSNVVGTASDITTKGKILFIEDIGELLYKADRMLYQLKRSGKLASLAGLIVGGFTDMSDTERPFGTTINEIIQHLVQEYSYPVCYGFPVSHNRENYALKCGVEHQLTITAKSVALKEL